MWPSALKPTTQIPSVKRVQIVNTWNNGLLLIALSFLSLNLSGCSGKGDRPELGLVTGTITMDGQPLSGIAVVFTPDDGRPARGKTDSEGKYELTYVGHTQGAKIGHHRVEIAPSEEGEEDAEETGDTENTGAAKKPGKAGKVRIPARYNVKSTLEADVEPGANVFDFQLDSKPSA
jgi:hypothetical protein